MKNRTLALAVALTLLAAPFAAAEDDPFTALYTALKPAAAETAVDARPAQAVQAARVPAARAARPQAAKTEPSVNPVSAVKARWSSAGSSWRDTCPQDDGRQVNVVGYSRSNRLVVRCGTQVLREFHAATGMQDPKTGAPFQTPTGTFSLKRNASTKYHAAWIFYQGASGAPYEIHGYPSNAWESQSELGNWTLGCFALRNFEMDWLSGQVQDGTRFTVVN